MDHEPKYDAFCLQNILVSSSLGMYVKVVSVISFVSLRSAAALCIFSTFCTATVEYRSVEPSLEEFPTLFGTRYQVSISCIN